MRFTVAADIMSSGKRAGGGLCRRDFTVRVLFLPLHTKWDCGSCSTAKASATTCVSAAVAEQLVLRGVRNTFAETQAVCLSRLSRDRHSEGLQDKVTAETGQARETYSYVVFSLTTTSELGKTLHLAESGSPGMEKTWFYISAPVLGLVSIAMDSAEEHQRQVSV